MIRKLSMPLVLAALLLFGAAVPAAYAVLERSGPVSAANGYPAWYQDKTGLGLEFCTPLNQAELDNGWCTILPANLPTGLAPEVFPGNFSDEHFYWIANAGTTAVGGGTGLVLALEGAFAIGPVISGDQIVFGRVRIRIASVPFDGDYKVYTPFGDFDFPGLVQGDRLFFTSDIGITCGADFNCALASAIGPFLLPSVVPGGAELPPIPDLVAGQDPFYDALVNAGAATPPAGTGKKYIADPARIGPVTGSPLLDFVSAVDGLTYNHNRFRIEGTPTATGVPEVYVDEENFTLGGRVFTGQMAGRVNVQRATYTDNGTGDRRVDVFANGEPTTAGRLPAQAKPAAVLPLLSFYPAPPPADPVTGESLLPLSAPLGVAAVQMFNVGGAFWGQAPIPAGTDIPTAVTVKDHNSRDASGAIVEAFFEKRVTDLVTITDALYTPTSNGGTLTVTAVSSDAANPPTLTLSGFGDLTGGGIAFSPLIAPPSTVLVSSTRGGVSELQVTTAPGQPSGGTAPLAVNDTLNINEDSGTTIVDVLANDTFTPPATVTIVDAPRLGTAVVNGDGTISYTPNLNAFGSDALTYKLTVGGVDSNLGGLAITIAPVNDLPVAVNDSASALAGVAKQINVLVNDTDPDGATDLANAANLIVLTAGATVTGGAGGVVTFTAAAGGTYQFTYQAQDKAGALSANTATVTVTVTGAETLTVTRSEYTQSSRRWRVIGTSTVNAGQTITITYANGTMRQAQLVNGVLTTNATGQVIGTAVVTAGTWTLDFILPSALGILNPTNTGNTLPNGSSFWTSPPRNIRATSSLAGATVTANLTIR